MKVAAILTESMADWNPTKWVHFSNVPYLKINPNPKHSDPIGIYFFPPSFQPRDFWLQHLYRFEVELLPTAHVLDLDRASDADLQSLLDAAPPEARQDYDEVMQRYPTDDHADIRDRFWSALQRGFGYGNTAKMRWNKFLRQQGYDAVFDDTKAIHSLEPQLLVLNPRAIRITDMVRQGDSGFAAVQKVLKDVIAIAERLGVPYEVTEPRRHRNRYNRNANLRAAVKMTRGMDNYASVEITTDEGPQGFVPKTVRVSLRYTRPSLGYGSGGSYSIAGQNYEFHGLTSMEMDLQKIFSAPPGAYTV